VSGLVQPENRTASLAPGAPQLPSSSWQLGLANTPRVLIQRGPQPRRQLPGESMPVPVLAEASKGARLFPATRKTRRAHEGHVRKGGD
jgi:hypothetical protein